MRFGGLGDLNLGWSEEETREGITGLINKGMWIWVKEIRREST